MVNAIKIDFNVNIPMRDRVKLRADVYRPSTPPLARRRSERTGKQFGSHPSESLLFAEGIVPTDIGPDVLRRVTVHQLTFVHWMVEAADFVLDHM